MKVGSVENKAISLQMIPLKIKIFMLFVENKVILTKENMGKRNWKEE
jgi:hypothetical protein